MSAYFFHQRGSVCWCTFGVVLWVRILLIIEHLVDVLLGVVAFAFVPGHLMCSDCAHGCIAGARAVGSKTEVVEH